ncbi:hypothetical protein BBJ28_00012300 [Nothophytophthora sp. Chile5]|nr:hypothetical protein BBJ28_00012300 [Nothophytophthora sp. Chile5]
MVVVDPDDDDDDLHVRFNGRNGSTTDGYLLTEIFLATSNIVTDVEIESSAEVVFEDNVLVSSNTNEELQLKASDASVVFVSAASTSMALQDLKLELSDSASLQFSMDSITVREDAQLQAHDASTITVLTSTFTVDDLDLDAENSGTICISAEDLTAGSYDGEAASKISLPNASSKYSSTGSLDCTEVSVPAREPKCVSNGCSDSSNDSTTSSTPTPTTSTTSETNTPASTTASPEGATTSDQTSAVAPLYTSHAFAISLAAGLLVTAWL